MTHLWLSAAGHKPKYLTTAQVTTDANKIPLASIASIASNLSSLSKQDLEHVSKIDLLGFAAIVFPYSC